MTAPRSTSSYSSQGLAELREIGRDEARLAALELIPRIGTGIVSREACARSTCLRHRAPSENLGPQRGIDHLIRLGLLPGLRKLIREHERDRPRLRPEFERRAI